MTQKPNAFSLFIKDFTDQFHPEMRGAKWSCLEEASRAWENLPIERKEYYKEKAKHLRKVPNASPNKSVKPQPKKGVLKVSQPSAKKKTVDSYSLTIPELKTYINICVQKFCQESHKTWFNNFKVLLSKPIIFLAFSTFNNIPFFGSSNGKGIEIDPEIIPNDIDYIGAQRPNCIPVELTLIEYTLNEGIRACFHEYIKPGEIPIGYTFEAIRSSNETHKIPKEGHKEAKSINEIMSILTKITHRYEFEDIPVYVMSSQFDSVSGSLSYMAQVAGVRNPFKRLLYFETLIKDMINVCKFDELKNSLQSIDIEKMIDSMEYLYNEENRCAFHYDLQCRWCSMRECLTYCYFMADHITSLFNVTNSPDHTLNAKSAKSKMFSLC